MARRRASSESDARGVKSRSQKVDLGKLFLLSVHDYVIYIYLDPQDPAKKQVLLNKLVLMEKTGFCKSEYVALTSMSHHTGFTYSPFIFSLSSICSDAH